MELVPPNKENDWFRPGWNHTSYKSIKLVRIGGGWVWYSKLTSTPPPPISPLYNCGNCFVCARLQILDASKVSKDAFENKLSFIKLTRILNRLCSFAFHWQSYKNMSGPYALISAKKEWLCYTTVLNRPANFPGHLSKYLTNVWRADGGSFWGWLRTVVVKIESNFNGRLNNFTLTFMHWYADWLDHPWLDQ